MLRPLLQGKNGTGVEMATKFRLDVQEIDPVKDREQRRARQEAYRRELNLQVRDSQERRQIDAQRIRELEARHELQSVSFVITHLSFFPCRELLHFDRCCVEECT